MGSEEVVGVSDHLASRPVLTIHRSIRNAARAGRPAKCRGEASEVPVCLNQDLLTIIGNKAKSTEATFLKSDFHGTPPMEKRGGNSDRGG